jgi:hypothetical protein
MYGMEPDFKTVINSRRSIRLDLDQELMSCAAQPENAKDYSVGRPRRVILRSAVWRNFATAVGS